MYWNVRIDIYDILWYGIHPHTGSIILKFCLGGHITLWEQIPWGLDICHFVDVILAFILAAIILRLVGATCQNYELPRVCSEGIPHCHKLPWVEYKI